MTSDRQAALALLALMTAAFVLLTPLGAFNSWVPASFHRGYYAITQIDPADDMSFYSFVRSPYFDHDLDFTNEEWIGKTADGNLIRRGYIQAHHITKTGYSCALTHGLGNAVLWLPFLVIGNLCNRALGLGPEILPGYRPLELIWGGIAAGFYLLAGLLIFYKILRRAFAPWLSFATVVGMFLATEIPYYAFIRNRMTHCNEIFVFAAGMYFWEKIYRREDNRWDHGLMLCAFGFLALVRLNSALLLVLPLGLYLYPWRGKRSLMGVAAVAAMLLFSLLPMTVVLKILFDEPWHWEASGYYRQLSQSLDVFAVSPPDRSVYSILDLGFVVKHIKMIEAIFTPRFGFLWSTPLVVLGWLGLGLLCRRDRRRGLLFVAAYLPAFLFSHWKLGDDFGHRYLIVTLPLVAYGLAQMGQDLSRRFGEQRAKMVFGATIGLACVWMYLLLLQYKTAIPYNDARYCLRAFENLRYLGSQMPLFRSTSLPGLLFGLGGLQLRDKVDWVFLVVTPLAALAAFSALAFGFDRLRGCKLPRQGKTLVVVSYFAVVTGMALLFWLQNPPMAPAQIYTRLTDNAQMLGRQWPSRPLHHHTALYMLKLAHELQPQNPAPLELALQMANDLAQRYELQRDAEEATWFKRQAAALQAAK